MTGFRPDKWNEVLEEKNVRQDSFQAIVELSPWVRKVVHCSRSVPRLGELYIPGDCA